jgi:hypothetical protein
MTLLADLIPTPQHCRFTNTTFRITNATRICVPHNATPADQRSAHRIADDLRTATGRRIPILQTPWYAGDHVLRIAPPAPPAPPGPFEITQPPQRPEAYALSITPAGITLAAHDSPGLFYATRTLAQILRLRKSTGLAIPTVEILDHPALPHRAVMIDIARQVERPDYLQTLLQTLADYKHNMFVLYFEDKFRWKKHKALSHPLAYTPADFRNLAKTAEELHMQFVPALASLGHCEGLLQHPEVAHLREENAIYQLSLRHPGSRKLLKDLYEEILPLYAGKFFHINCDESPLLKGPPGRGGAGRKYLKESLRRFADHVTFLHDLLASHGKQTMMWGDMLLHYPDIMKTLPRDIIIVDWDYAPMANRTREAPDLFRREGFRVMVAPAAARSAQICYPTNFLLNDNIPNFIRQGHAAGAIGSMTTLWELFTTNSPVALPGLLAAAEVSWNPTATSPAHIARKIAAHRHGPEAAPHAARAYNLLSSHLFLERQVNEAANPALRPQRTYHLDSHELVPTDPFVYLTYRKSDWAEKIASRAARAVAACIDAEDKARWRHHFLNVATSAAMVILFQAERRLDVNKAAFLMLEAQQALDAQKLATAARKTTEAADRLQSLADFAANLISHTRAVWSLTKHPHDPGLDEAFLRRLQWTAQSLRPRIARLRNAAQKLAAGKPANLSTLLGNDPVLIFRVHNPSPHLVDLFKANITFTHDARTFPPLSHKNWYILPTQTYLTAVLFPTNKLPQQVRLQISRTDINPKQFPLQSRITLHPARTLTPIEILQGPPPADLETIDWRLLHTPNITYTLHQITPWNLLFTKAD